ncbi:uncharacterized protein J7T54_005868 [Emericellopsis cladophorae]|uniref:Uncharacterized protein n=1 Tax=Emericellopsis cladophorae TaxID=2686198 RepID=A0A9Q0BA87_9HYPO|nr:uncharacterized protein J7T54_005868 [Emericellopsis cladophorae]KAI6777576.1 hypothetical protein J7T54_005868 [Emericellopsis cladophorae]
MNFTIQVPNGTTNHGQPDLYCVPPDWKTFTEFFATNYLLHVLTVPAEPGEATSWLVFAAFAALVCPSAGVVRAIRVLERKPFWWRRGNDVQEALNAGALCTVVRTVVQEGARDDGYFSPMIPEESWTRDIFKWYTGDYAALLIAPMKRRVLHGSCVLPKGFELLQLPAGTPIKVLSGFERAVPPRDMDKGWFSNGGVRIGSNFNIAKGLVGLIQIVSGSVTLYQSRGDQIERYGYAAFGLSIVPYVFMSTLNLLAALVSPEYPAMYLALSPDVESAIAQGGIFEGAVATIDTGATDEELGTGRNNPPASTRKIYLYRLSIPRTSLGKLLLIGASFVPFSIFGGLSGFRSGNSTHTQRGFMMSWQVVGAVYWIQAELAKYYIDDESWLVLWAALVQVICLGAPAVGGMVMVGQMLREYGVCTRIDVGDRTKPFNHQIDLFDNIRVLLLACEVNRWKILKRLVEFEYDFSVRPTCGKELEL